MSSPFGVSLWFSVSRGGHLEHHLEMCSTIVVPLGRFEIWTELDPNGIPKQCYNVFEHHFEKIMKKCCTKKDPNE